MTNNTTDTKNKHYVVWVGKKPGVYLSWDECKENISKFPGARYKSFYNKNEAELAFIEGFEKYIHKAQPVVKVQTKFSEPNYNSVSVDAACSGNPGPMEYRGLNTKTGKVLFHRKFKYGTNNIGEFLAIVEALALLNKHKSKAPIYSDSQTALSWIQNKKVNSNLQKTKETEELYSIIARAEKWLINNNYTNQVLKWETKHWNEIPADFNRKK